MIGHQADLGPAIGRHQVAVRRLFAHVIEHIGKRVILGQLACGRKLLLAGSVLRSSTFGTFGRIRAFTLFAMRKRSWRNSGLRSVRKHAITARATCRRTAFAGR